MHKNGDVDEALLQEARRCLLAFKTLGVVVANVMKRDLATVRIVAVAIAVYRGFFRRDDGSDDLKSAFIGVWGKDYKNKGRLAVWQSRLSELSTSLRCLDSVRVKHLEAVLMDEDRRLEVARQRTSASECRRRVSPSPLDNQLGRRGQRAAECGLSLRDCSMLLRSLREQKAEVRLKRQCDKRLRL